MKESGCFVRLKSLSIIDDVSPCDEVVIKTRTIHIFHMCKKNNVFYFDKKIKAEKLIYLGNIFLL
jgi:hypothetical protein